MAGRVYKSSQLIQSVKRKGMLPETKATFTEQDFLDFATEEIDVGILPLIMSFNEDYYLYVDRIPITTPSVKRYKIPHRALGNKLRYVGLEIGNDIIPCFRIAFEDLYRGEFVPNTRYFYIENDEIVFHQELVQGSNLVMAYYLRPNALVPDEQMLKITAISGNTVTVSEGDINLFTSVSLVDFIDNDSPNKILKIDHPVVAINPTLNTITFSSLPSNVAVGDYICAAEKTAIPQIPTEAQSLLAQRVVARCLEALGASEELQIANAKIAEIEQKIVSILDNRVESNPRKVLVKRNRFRNYRRF